MAISTIVVRGYGSWAAVKYLPTLGYGSAFLLANYYAPLEGPTTEYHALEGPDPQYAELEGPTTEYLSLDNRS